MNGTWSIYIYICDHILVVLLSFKCTLHIIIMLVYANLSTFRPFLPFNDTQTTKTLRDFVPPFHSIPLSIYVHLQFSLSYLFALSFPFTFPIRVWLVDYHYHSVDDGERRKKNGKVFFWFESDKGLNISTRRHRIMLLVLWDFTLMWLTLVFFFLFCF